MRSVKIASGLFIILLIIIAFNSYYINKTSTELLDLIFALPSEYNYINSLNAQEPEKIESFKSEINKIETQWEKNQARICLVTRYSDYERISTALTGLKEYFFAGRYADYLMSRKKLIAALEKQKASELPNWENIF